MLYATRLSGDVEAGRDAAQETFLRALARGPDAVAGREAEWLYTVCRNLVIDRHRRERRMAATDPPETARDEAPSAGMERDDERRELAAWLARLPANQREVVRLKFQHERSYAEIAGITGLSVANVGFLLHTALKTLRALAARGVDA